ncbi:MAG TPA: tol-pal system protein YbgF [Fibrobacteria bacterium]|nr:tol-pal system protein YbgF [Fibrobacteria bacterium]
MGNGNRIPTKSPFRGPRARLSFPSLRPYSAAAALLFLCACATAPKTRSGDPSLPEIDVLQLKENSDEALKLAQENKLELQTLASKVRELEGRISSLGDELANLPVSKLDELTQQMALMTQQLRGLEDRLARGAPAPKGMATFAPTSLDTSAASKETAPADPDAAPKITLKPFPPKAPARKPPASDAEAQLYKKAFDLYYGRDYGQAVGRFEELLKKFPASTYADNCYYWIGECQFAQGNYAKAITGFRKVFAFPETEKADDAQLKLGYCYLRLGEKKLAAEEFKKVVSLYPDSEYTERAKEELAKLE